jgi:hypothetical protein
MSGMKIAVSLEVCVKDEQYAAMCRLRSEEVKGAEII